MAKSDPYDLNRFVEAQSPVYDQALAELRAGRKRTHWMWFVFPQIEGLGSSDTARFYAIADRAEAAAYLKHPLLGPRLRQCAAALLGVEGRTGLEIRGSPDDLKARSCMTLFAELPDADPVFRQVLEKYYAGEPCRRTLEILDAR